MKLRLRRQRHQINHSSAAGFTRKLCTSGGAIPGELQDSSRDLPIEVLEHVTIFTNDSSAQNRRATHNHCGPILNVRTYFRCVRGFAPHNSKITIDIGARDSALHARVTAWSGARVLLQHFSQYSPSIFIPPVSTHESPIRGGVEFHSFRFRFGKRSVAAVNSEDFEPLLNSILHLTITLRYTCNRDARR